MFILAGDIGGTKTNLALVEEKDPRNILRSQKFPSKDFKSLQEIIDNFIKDTKNISRACFGVAGPVKNNRCQTTNLPWVIDGQKISQNFHIPIVILMNDLEANSWGISWLSDSEIEILHKGEKLYLGNKALIAAGTGLGEAGIFWDGSKYLHVACEGGHADFAATNQEQWELRKFLSDRFGHVSYERILSGPGLVNIYDFCVKKEKMKSNQFIELEMTIDDPSKVIVENAKNNGCHICKKTLDMFVHIYGQETGNLALKYLAFDGVYIGGGIAPKIKEFMKSEIFINAFLDKGRFKDLLSRVNVKLILNQNTALLGAIRCAVERG